MKTDNDKSRKPPLLSAQTEIEYPICEPTDDFHIRYKAASELAPTDITKLESWIKTDSIESRSEGDLDFRGLALYVNHKSRGIVDHLSDPID